jgi:hypothetical protein
MWLVSAASVATLIAPSGDVLVRDVRLLFPNDHTRMRQSRRASVLRRSAGAERLGLTTHVNSFPPRKAPATTTEASLLGGQCFNSHKYELGQGRSLRQRPEANELLRLYEALAFIEIRHRNIEMRLARPNKRISLLVRLNSPTTRGSKIQHRAQSVGRELHCGEVIGGMGREQKQDRQKCGGQNKQHHDHYDKSVLPLIVAHSVR